MPLSAIIDVIEQLILDKAEPSVIKGNLVLLRDQAEEVERRLRAFESGSDGEHFDVVIERQSKEFDAVRAELANALEEIERLRYDEAKRKNEAKRRTKAEDKILVDIYMLGAATLHDLGDSLEIEIGLADLEKDGFIYPRPRDTSYYGSPVAAQEWGICDKGKRYLLQYGLAT